MARARIDHKAGQGATEYLILLAVVLIVALVSIALLGFFPGIAQDQKITQSQAYWRSASPIAVVDGVVTNSSFADLPSIFVTLKNNGGTPIELLAVSGAGGGGWAALEWTPEYGDISDGRKYQYISRKMSPEYDRKYMIYSSRYPERGYDYQDDQIILAPGETVKIGWIQSGYGVWGITYPGLRICDNYDYNAFLYANFGWSVTQTTPTGKNYQQSGFTIVYNEINDGVYNLKKETGIEPLVLPCVDSPQT